MSDNDDFDDTGESEVANRVGSDASTRSAGRHPTGQPSIWSRASVAHQPVRQTPVEQPAAQTDVAQTDVAQPAVAEQSDQSVQSTQPQSQPTVDLGADADATVIDDSTQMAASPLPSYTESYAGSGYASYGQTSYDQQSYGQQSYDQQQYDQYDQQTSYAQPTYGQDYGQDSYAAASQTVQASDAAYADTSYADSTPADSTNDASNDAADNAYGDDVPLPKDYQSMLMDDDEDEEFNSTKDQFTTVYDLLDQIESLVEESKTTFFTSQVRVDRDELVSLLRELKAKLPVQLERASALMRESERRLENAQSQASAIVAAAQSRSSTIIREANERAQFLTSQENVTAMATEKARTILNTAQAKADKLVRGADNYSTAVLTELSEQLAKASHGVQSGLDVLAERQREAAQDLDHLTDDDYPHA
ncbi:hypothetical protein [Bifidobacterium callimiconis]|uniref:Cell division protein n=1 Tax=Bifidobacterium callimiconis TaxID=2306973 RepID=A0A430FBJ8_9BIFI|nr:hypothetical protein [Bifidobacterium callimiconis]RSX50224.1 cell division protein [Bifidobacterium callimiconis]